LPGRFEKIYFNEKATRKQSVSAVAILFHYLTSESDNESPDPDAFRRFIYFFL